MRKNGLNELKKPEKITFACIYDVYITVEKQYKKLKRINSIPSFLNQDARLHTRSINDTEKRYAQIKKNMMSIDNAEMMTLTMLTLSMMA